MKTAIDQHQLVKLDASITAQSLSPNDRSRTFRKLYLYPAKDYTVRGQLTANSAIIYWGKDGAGPLVLNESLDTTDPAVSITIPDSCPEMALQDIWISGTQGDGVWFSYVTSNPTK